MKQIKPRLNNLLTFSSIIAFSVIAIIWIISMLKKHPTALETIEGVIAYLGITLMVILPLFLSCCYLYCDLTKKVFIDEINKTIIIRKRSKDLVITPKDILDACIIRTNPGNRSLFPLYKYVILVLKERRRIFITNLLCEPEYIFNVLGLKMNVVESVIPFFDLNYGNAFLTTKEFELKVLEYENSLKDHSDKMLNDIILQKETYADYAREAAKRILKKRE